MCQVCQREVESSLHTAGLNSDAGGVGTVSGSWTLAYFPEYSNVKEWLDFCLSKDQGMHTTMATQRDWNFVFRDAICSIWFWRNRWVFYVDEWTREVCVCWISAQAWEWQITVLDRRLDLTNLANSCNAYGVDDWLYLIVSPLVMKDPFSDQKQKQGLTCGSCPFQWTITLLNSRKCNIYPVKIHGLLRYLIAHISWSLVKL